MRTDALIIPFMSNARPVRDIYPKSYRKSSLSVWRITLKRSPDCSAPMMPVGHVMLVYCILEVHRSGNYLESGDDATRSAVLTCLMQAAKLVGWTAGIGATAFAASYLTSHDVSNLTASEDSESNGRLANIEVPDLPGSSRPHGSPSSATRDFLLAAGGVCGLLGVGAGAFGFHGLKRSACMLFFLLCAGVRTIDLDCRHVADNKDKYILHLSLRSRKHIVDMKCSQMWVTAG